LVLDVDAFDFSTKVNNEDWVSISKSYDIIKILELLIYSFPKCNMGERSRKRQMYYTCQVELIYIKKAKNFL